MRPIWPSLGAALVVLSSGCARPAPPASSNEKEATPPVTVVKPQKKTVQRLIEQPGYNVEAFRRAPLYAKVAGYVRAVNVDIGDRVKEGDVLVELSVPELGDDLRRKEAAVKQADAEVLQAKSALAAAAAALKSAAAQVKEAEAAQGRAKASLTRAKGQSDRLADAGRRGVIDKEAVAEARHGLEAAEAVVKEAEARVQSAAAARDESAARRDKAQADVGVKEASLDVAKAARDEARTMVGYTKLKAPFPGVVTRRLVDLGHFVQPAGAKGDALLVVERTDRVRVFVNVPELDAAWLRLDPEGEAVYPAVVRAQGLGGRKFHGAVTRTADALDPRNRTLRTEVDLPNLDGQLRSGMYVHVTITVARPDVWALPEGAVLEKDGEAFCFVREGGKAVRTPLRVGLRGGGLVEVLGKRTRPGDEAPWEALTGEEEVITSNPGALTDGQAVPNP